MLGQQMRGQVQICRKYFSLIYFERYSRKHSKTWIIVVTLIGGFTLCFMVGYIIIGPGMKWCMWPLKCNYCITLA